MSTSDVTPATDRLAEIKTRYGFGAEDSDSAWLIAEVERLRDSVESWQMAADQNVRISMAVKAQNVSLRAALEASQTALQDILDHGTVYADAWLVDNEYIDAALNALGESERAVAVSEGPQ